MRRHHLLLLSFDLILIGLATVFARAVRENFEITRESFTGLVPYVLLTLAVAVPVVTVSGLNRTIWRLSTMPDYVRVVIAVVVIVLASLALAFAYNRLDGVARSLPVLQTIVMACALVGVRVLIRLRHALRKRQRSANSGQPLDHGALEIVLVVGLNRITELYLLSAAEFAADRIRIAGILGNSERHTGRLVQQHKILGAPEEVESVLQDLEVHGVSVDRIVVTSAFEHLSSNARKALLEIERTSGIKLELFAEWTKLDLPMNTRGRSASSPPSEDGRPAFSFSGVDLDALAHRPYWRVKRVIDLAGAACLLVVTGPIALLVAVLVTIDVGWPVVFWQERPGRGGRPFKLYKFRTMATAHDLLGRRLPDAERQTFLGQIIRRTRLDELPQLFNILVGEMSFVGPRPLLPVDQPSAFGARLLVRPGLTGWAQVQGGRKVTASDKAALDVWYVRNASLRLDVTILWRTVLVVIFGERVGAAAIRGAWYELQQAGVCSAPSSSTVARHDSGSL
jgi:lipopolysaccharide/colanic/teichoic acid biosynthesis glycosyltransferase